MIIYDEEGLAKKQAITRMEEGREHYLLSCENEVKDRVHVARIGNIGQRLGRQMFPAELERRLKKLNANLFFEVIAENPTHKRASLLIPNGRKVLVVYENSLMPERSIPKLRTMEVPDPTFTHLDRKDMPTDPDALRPGWRRVQIPWGEAKRGWRTVLVRLIQQGAITVTQAETEFGSDETPEWRQHTGKGEFTTPF
jgi:hypothetical protein